VAASGLHSADRLSLGEAAVGTSRPHPGRLAAMRCRSDGIRPRQRTGLRRRGYSGTRLDGEVSWIMLVTGIGAEHDKGLRTGVVVRHLSEPRR